MENKQPLLSICIPTYNRSYILKEVLERYVSCSEFDDDVEIVILDNASEDDTKVVCEEYAAEYNVFYYRNENNIFDRSFPKLLDFGRGEYLKLLNDCVYLTNESLKYLKDSIRANLASKRAIFFTGGLLYTDKKAETVIDCKNADDYMAAVSTWVTYNNLFGAWKDHWTAVKSKTKYAELHLQQVDWSYQIVTSQGGCILYNSRFFYSNANLGIRSGYNFFKVHLDNYYSIISPYILNGQISKETFEKDKKNFLYFFREQLGLALLFNYNHNWQFDTSNTLSLLLKYYRHNIYIYLFLILLPFINFFYFLRFYFYKIGSSVFHLIIRK